MILDCVRLRHQPSNLSPGTSKSPEARGWIESLKPLKPSSVFRVLRIYSRWDLIRTCKNSFTLNMPPAGFQDSWGGMEENTLREFQRGRKPI